MGTPFIPDYILTGQQMTYHIDFQVQWSFLGGKASVQRPWRRPIAAITWKQVEICMKYILTSFIGKPRTNKKVL